MQGWLNERNAVKPYSRPGVYVVKIKNLNIAYSFLLCLNNVIGLKNRPYESNFSQAVFNLGVIHRYLLREPPPIVPNK